MEYGGGDNYTVDRGCMATVSSLYVWAAALAERWLLSVTHSAAAVYIVDSWRYIITNITYVFTLPYCPKILIIIINEAEIIVTSRQSFRTHKRTLSVTRCL